MRKRILFIVFLFLCFQQAVFAKDAVEYKYLKAGVHFFEIDTKKLSNKIKPLMGWGTVNSVWDESKYELVVNGGFFDMKNKQDVSYVVIEGKTVGSPFNNSDMIYKLEADKRLEAVLNRTELRILENEKGEIKFDIMPHFAPPEAGWTIKHSIQAGPLILKDDDFTKESFIIKDDKGKIIAENASVTKRRERTILALKKDKLYLIIFDKNSKMSLSEVWSFCEKYKFDKIMALDGGGSTAFNYKDIKVFSEGTEGREVKSFLVIEK